ncbi:hypothetical protein TD95_002732 [Thielaviopsis punctulata]|uniref:Phospholipid metabolism enzyme regulator n=1 Tax=Thielaviopsis punctulata TaxID=72032 RepID=A0A0F4ZN31_9PEZI|nr:hypothetical protein TD95_002732 [Thielaviopsis punctulata]
MASRPSPSAYSGAAPLDSRNQSPTRSSTRSSPRNTTGPASRARKASNSSNNNNNTQRASRAQRTSQKANLSILTTPWSGSSAVRASGSESATTTSPRPPVSEARRDGLSRWPVSPRFQTSRSNSSNSNPQPSSSYNNNAYPMQRTDPLTTRRYASSITSQSSVEMSESETDDSQTPSGLRTPTMNNINSLATVQETSLPNSPGRASDAAMARISERLTTEGPVDRHPLDSDTASISESRPSRSRSLAPHSESDTASMYHEGRRVNLSAVPQPPMMSRQSSTFSSFKGKPSHDGSSMIVESETVTSVPQIALAPVPQAGHSLRPATSTETIRPKTKKERKKHSRKQAVNPGAASSKAEIFEYKVASAVDEADDSDSDETFVYESNPHEGPRRYHSRTPSMTSMTSQLDRQSRTPYSNADGGSGPSMSKKKFANTHYNSDIYNTGDEDAGRGSSRVNAGSSRNRHGKFGLRPNSHSALFDSDHNMAGSNRSKGYGTRQPPTPTNGRFLQTRPPVSRKSTANHYNHSNIYDMDEPQEDEHTPLMTYGTRVPRNSRVARRQPNPRLIESQTYRSRPSFLNRLAACLVVTIMVLLVIAGAIGFMFATSQPLTGIEIVSVDNVLASEPELMFDLTVRAHNPNIVVVTIDDANLEVFAKSEHAGTDLDWHRKLPNGDPGKESDLDAIHIKDDPPEDLPDEAAPNMRLGTITQFDSPLSFEGLFFHKSLAVSTGSMRLPLPGNSTVGGMERWSKIIQDDFDLIVKGTVKYYLPLSQRMRSASISGRTRVKPNSANDPVTSPNMTAPVR